MAAFRWRKENLATKFALQFKFLLELGLQGFSFLISDKTALLDKMEENIMAFKGRR
jgi:hypothetical protein